MKIIAWTGACEVHERFTGAELRAYREAHPGIDDPGPPECPPDVIAEADFTGSTAQMTNWVKTNRPAQVLLVTECSMADEHRGRGPGIDFIARATSART